MIVRKKQKFKTWYFNCIKLKYVECKRVKWQFFFHSFIRCIWLSSYLNWRGLRSFTLNRDLCGVRTPQPHICSTCYGYRIERSQSEWFARARAFGCILMLAIRMFCAIDDNIYFNIDNILSERSILISTLSCVHLLSILVFVRRAHWNLRPLNSMII